MWFTGFLLQGLHLRLDFTDNMAVCPQPRQSESELVPGSNALCNQTYENTGIDNHKYRLAVSVTSMIM